MRVAHMPFVTWDNQKGRAQYQRRYPADVVPFLGKAYRHKYPATVSLRVAEELSVEQTADFLARVDEARMRFGTPAGMAAALRALRQRRASIRERTQAVIAHLGGEDAPLFPGLAGRSISYASNRMMKFIRALGISDKQKVFYSWWHTVCSALEKVR